MKRRADTELTKDKIDAEEQVNEGKNAAETSLATGTRKIAVVRRKTPATTDAVATPAVMKTADVAPVPAPQFSFGSALTTSSTPSFSFGLTTTTPTVTPAFSFGTSTTDTASTTTTTVASKTEETPAAAAPAEQSSETQVEKPTTETPAVTENTVAEETAKEADGTTTESVAESTTEQSSDKDTDKDTDKDSESTKDSEKNAEKEKTDDANKEDSENKKFVLHSKPLFPFSTSTDNPFSSGSSSSTFGSFGNFGTGSSSSSAFGSGSAFGTGSAMMSFSSFKTEESTEFGDNSAGLQDLDKNSEWTATTELDIPKVQEHGGDEADETVYTASVKCYQLDAGEYKERGIGDLKVNSMKGDKPRARLLMRVEKTQKLIVNDLITKDTHRSIQNEKFVRVSCIKADASIVTYLFRLRNAALAEELLEAINKLISSL